MLYRLLRPLLFSLAPERAHHLVFAALRPLESLAAALPLRLPPTDPSLAQELFGLTFANPIGLAAGLDKNAELPHLWPLLGFGYAELGTITAQAQAGNPAPRLFRLAESHALINRMGFNNDGAAAIAERLRRRLRARRPGIPIGLNIGKSKLAPLESAAADYRASFQRLAPLADYVAVNVSSPNTAGLRSLQSQSELAKLLAALREESAALSSPERRAPPLLVKLAPDLGDEELRDVAAIAEAHGVAALIATNTTVRRDLLPAAARHAQEVGGLSGAPLAGRSTEVIRTLYRCTGGRLPIVGVGGIFTAADAYRKLRAGASLVQVYTGLIYEGPRLPRRLCAGLAELLRRDGFASVRQVVGADAG